MYLEYIFMSSYEVLFTSDKSGLKLHYCVLEFLRKFVVPLYKVKICSSRSVSLLEYRQMDPTEVTDARTFARKSPRNMRDKLPIHVI
jgi:hypothetical protein